MNGYGSSGNDESIDCIAVSGGFVTTGYFSGTVNFDGVSLTSAGATDVFVTKMDTDGNVDWAVQLGGPVTERPTGIDVDNAGNLYITGNFYGATTMGGTALSPPDTDSEVFVIKLNSAGTVQWVKHFGGPNEDIALDISVQDDGDFAVTGQFRETLEAEALNLTGTPYGEDETDEGDPSLDLFVLGSDSDGNWQWVTQGATESDGRGLAIANSDTYFYLTGQFSDTLTFGAMTVNNTVANAAFVSRLGETDGSVDWLTRMSAGFVQCHDIIFEDGNAYVTGDFTQELAVFDGSTDFIAAPYDNNVFVGSFSPSGTLNWMSAEGSYSQITSQAITREPDGSLVIGGHFYCRLDGFADDAGNDLWRSIDEWDIFLCNYSTSGIRQWEKHVGGYGDDRCRGLAEGAEFSGPFMVGSGSGYTFTPGDFASSTALVDYPDCVGENLYYCDADGDYGAAMVYDNTGGADALFWYVRFEDYALLDPFRRTDSGCDLSVGEVCFGFTPNISECGDCPDTLSICELPTEVFTYSPYTSVYNFQDEDNDYLVLQSDWYGGIWGDPHVDAIEGTYTSTWTSADGCFEYTNSVVVDYFEPECIEVWDELGINEGTCLPDSVLACEMDTLTLWAEFPGGTITGWSSADFASPKFGPENEDLDVICTDTYFVNGVDTNGCNVSTPIIVFMGHQIELFELEMPTTISGGGDSFEVMEGDSFVFCNPATLFSELIDANESEWISHNTQANWTLLADGDYFGASIDYGEEEGSYDLPHNYIDIIDETASYTLQCIVESFWDYPCPDSSWVDTLELNFHVTILDAEDDFLTLDGPEFLCPGECATFDVVCDAPYTITNSYNVDWSADSLQLIVCETGSFSFNWESDLEDCTLTGYYYQNLQLLEPPNIEAVPDHFVICPGDSLMLTTDTQAEYQWFGPLGEPLGTEQDLWITSPGSYVVGITTEDGCYMESVAAETFAYNTPFLEFTPNSDLCFEEEVMVEIVTSEDATVTWGEPLTGGGLTQWIDEAGTYTVSVEFCDIVTDFDIEITDTPIDATLYADSYIQCVDTDVITLWADSTMTTYEWSTGEEGVSTIEVDSPGEYLLTVTNEVGCIATDTAWVMTPEEATPVATSTAACEGTPIILYSGTLADVYWSNEPFGADTLGWNSPFWHPSIGASTWFYAMNPDTSCGPLMDSVLVEILDGGIFNLDSTLCLPSTLVLEAWCSVDFADISWTPAAQLSDPNALTTDILSNTTTTYVLELSTANGCLVTDEVTLTQIIETTTLPEDSVMCEGDVLTIDLPWPSDYTIEWTGGAMGPSTTWDETTSIQVTVTSPDGCVSSDGMELTVLPYPVVPLPSDTTLCEGLYLDVNIGNETFDILWDNGETSPEHIITSGGPTSVTVTHGPCVTEHTTTVEILVNPTYQVAQDSILCFEEPPYAVSLDAGNDGSTYLWHTGETSQSIVVENPGYTWVQVTLPNGCMQEYEYEVLEFCEGSLYIPNTFTPNQDGHNDVWTIVADGLLTFEIWVFNRWGEVVYHSTNPDEVWIGDHKDHGTHYVPDGVYTWLCKASWPTFEGLASPKNLTGHVTVIR